MTVTPNQRENHSLEAAVLPLGLPLVEIPEVCLLVSTKGIIFIYPTVHPLCTYLYGATEEKGMVYALLRGNARGVQPIL